jgi:hypothetical protein
MGALGVLVVTTVVTTPVAASAASSVGGKITRSEVLVGAQYWAS